MINHASTMLLNRPAAYYAGQPNAVFIPVEFATAALPPSLQAVRAAIFPDGCSPATELSILQAILPAIHMPDLQPYVNVWDSRMTYTVPSVGRVEFVTPAITITPTQSPDCDLTPIYRLATNTAPVSISESGNFLWQFRTGDQYEVAYTNNRGVASLVRVVPGKTATQSQEIALIPNRLYASMLMPSGVLTGTYTYKYQYVLAPSYGLFDIAHNLNQVLSNGQIRADLFRSFDPVADTVSALRFTYESGVELPLRVGAALLSFVYQVTRLTVLGGPFDG